MTDLTEQLYAGTLPTGHYYFNNGVETYIVLYKNINSKHLILQEPEGLTVISEVPSYEEWKKAYECVVSENEEITMLKEELKDYENQHKQDGICYDDIFCKLELARKENRQLRELLKECRYIMGIEKEFASCHVEKDKLCKLLTKINKELGEDK